MTTSLRTLALTICVYFALALLRPASASLPALRPRKVTFASSDPIAAQDWVVKYLGAKAIPEGPKNASGSCALIKWVEFQSNVTCPAGKCGYQFHFVQNPRKVYGIRSVQQIHGHSEWLHGNITSSSWDEWMDFHVGLATSSLDPFIKRLQAGEEPFFVRQRQTNFGTLYSLFAQIPHGIMLEVVSKHLTIVKAPVFPPEARMPTVLPFDLPETKPEASSPLPETKPEASSPLPETKPEASPPLPETKPEASPPLPELFPHHISYGSSDPVAAAAFAQMFLGATLVKEASTDEVLLLNFTGSYPWPYYMEYSHHKAARKGYIEVSEVEKYLLKLRAGNVSSALYDQFMDDHLGMNSVFVGEQYLNQFLDLFAKHGLPFFHRMAGWDGVDLFISDTGGVILEVQVHVPGGTNRLKRQTWDLCDKQH